VTAHLVTALVLSAAIGLGIAALYLVWPRRLTVDEWMFHRRALTTVGIAATPPSAGPRWMPAGRPWLNELFGELVPAPDADLRLLQLLGRAVPTERLGRHLGIAAAAGGSAALVATLIVAAATHSGWVAVMAPVVGLILAVVTPVAQLYGWKRGAMRIRSAIERRLPRVLTGARVLLEAGAVTPEGALAAAVASYEDHASELLREALRIREVRRLDLEAALDDVAERYADDEIHRLADAFRVGQRYGTGMSALLADVCRRMRQTWHARYRERITRAPVLMLLPALVFFVIPLLGLVMYLIFTPLLGTLGRL